MELIFQRTHQFEKNLRKLSLFDKEKVVKQVNQMAENFSNDKDLFFKHARLARITLRNGLKPSLYIMRSGLKLRILFTIDDDPIFEKRIFTLLRIVKPDEYKKVFSQLAESMYQQYLIEYEATDEN